MNMNIIVSVDGKPEAITEVPCHVVSEGALKIPLAFIEVNWSSLTKELDNPSLLYHGLKDFKLTREQFLSHLEVFELLGDSEKQSLFAGFLLALGNRDPKLSGRAREYGDVINSRPGLRGCLERLLDRAEVSAEESLYPGAAALPS